jgi:uncharacterized phage protein (TIGR02220 family)
MNIYDLSRNYWNHAFENPEKIKPVHTAIYFFALDQCNRLGWKEKFGLPTDATMEATGIKSYATFKTALQDLVDFGMIEMIERSRNQYTSNIIGLKLDVKAHTKALDKATSKHTSKQLQSTSESTHQSTVSIDRQVYNSTNTQTNCVTVDSSSPNVEEESVGENLDEDGGAGNEEPTDPLNAELPKEKSCAKKEKVESAPISPETFPANTNTPPTGQTWQERAKESRESQLIADATAVIEHLNRMAGKKFQPVPTNLKFITARLKEGATVQDCFEVIELQCFKWLSSPKWSHYLRPETLFNATKFASYHQSVLDAKKLPNYAAQYTAATQPTKKPTGSSVSISRMFESIDRMCGPAIPE